ATAMVDRGHANLGASWASEFRWSCRTNRGHASHSRRGEAMDFRATIFACVELFHAPAGPGSPAARRLRWLADAPNAWRPAGRWSVHLARHHLHHGAQLRLRALGPSACRHGSVLRT